MRNLLSYCLLLWPGIALADPAITRTLDFASSDTAAKIELYRGDSKTLTIRLLNDGAAISTNGYTPVFYFYTNTIVTNASCVWTTGSSFRVTLTTNNLATVGTYTYAAGVSNSAGVTVCQSGVFKITSNPNH